MKNLLKFESIILAFSYIFYLIFFLHFLRDLVIPIYGHDLDVEMYFGSRLIEKRRDGDPASLIASASKIYDELGWEAKYPNIYDIISHAVSWYKKLQ